MPTEVFYYRDGHGASPPLEFLEKLSHKEIARCLSQIDQLDGEELPAEMDRPIDETPLRVLTARTGRTRYRFTYARRGELAILIDATQGKTAKRDHKLDREQLQQAINEVTSADDIPSERLKSHREFVVEVTLSDPTLAALYTRARENAQFAVSLMRMRAAAGYTVDSLAERTGLSRARIESIERGRMPKLTTMRRLTDALQAKIVISSSSGITIEPLTVENKRVARGRRASATPGAATTGTAPNLTIT